MKFEDEKPIEISLEIASETVETMPMPQNRTTVGVGEAVNLTHPVGSVAWTTTAGSLSGDIGDSVTLTAPDTTQTVTVTGGGATIGFRVIAPNDVFMERDRSTGVLHTQDRPDSGIQTQPYLRPDNVNFHNVEYRERDVAAVTTGVYAPFNGMGHLRPGKQEPKTLSKIVLPGKGTGANAFDCVQSGDPGGSAPFTPGKISYAVPYEYRVGGGPFRPFATVMQQSVLGDDGSELTSSKAGAEGDTTVASPTVTLADCPNEPPPARVAT